MTAPRPPSLSARHRRLAWRALLPAVLLVACEQPLPVLDAVGGPPDLLAIFDVESTEGQAAARSAGPERLVLWRENDRVVQEGPAAGQLLVWRREPSGRVQHERILLERRLVVEFAPGDLAAIGAAPAWSQVTCLVPFEFLESRLARITARPFRGQPAVRYRGSVGGVRFDVLWLERLAVPAELDERRDRGSRHLRLVEVHPLETSPWRPPALAGFARLDFADLGDRRPDPALQALLRDLMTR